MDWNYDQAERATGINSESWRLWEKSRRHCSDVAGVARKIQAATGLSYQWLMLGGPLEEEVPMPQPPVGPAGLEPATYGLGVRKFSREDECIVIPLRRETANIIPMPARAGVREIAA